MTPEAPDTKPVAKAATDTVGALSLAFRFLALVERLLPAILLSWANHLRSQNKELAAAKKLTETKLDVAEKKHEAELAAATQSPVDTINSFLSK